MIRWAFAVISRPVLLSAVLTGAGAAVWLLVFPRAGTDLSAALARAGWASHYPGAAYLFSWYGGIYPAAYSVLAPYLLALTGVRAGLAGAAVVSAALLAWLLAWHRVPRPRAGAVWAAAGLWAALVAGQAPFILAMVTGLGGLAVASGRRPSGAPRYLTLAVLALLTSLISPVAGLFLGGCGAALAIAGRRRDGLVTAVAAGLPLAGMALALQHDAQPMGVTDAVPSLLVAALVLGLVPPRWRLVRIGAVGYGLAVLALWAVPTAAGSNIDRLSGLLAAPLLAGMGRARWRGLLPLGLAAAAAWQLAWPGLDLAHGNAPGYAPRTAALVRELRALHADTARVEAIPQYGHWAAEQLSPAVWLARGWERQLDTARDPLFYQETLPPGRYRAWLLRNAVRYVALSDATPDWSAVSEAALVNRGEPWLVPVWHDAYWRLYRVAGARPLASPPAVVLGTTPAQITVRMPRAGRTVVRVRWSPWLRSTGHAQLAPDGPWTSLTVSRPGRYRLTAPY